MCTFYVLLKISTDILNDKVKTYTKYVFKLCKNIQVEISVAPSLKNIATFFVIVYSVFKRKKNNHFDAVLRF